MKIPRLATWTVLYAALACAPLYAAQPQVEQPKCTQQAPAAIHGAWQSEDGGAQALFQDDRIILRKSGALSVATILKREPCELFVLYQGLHSSWKITSEKSRLTLQADEPLTLRPLSSIPPELDIDAPSLPPPSPVSPGDVKAVERELMSRAGKDQEAIRKPELRPQRPEIIADNLRYLRELTHRVGWIDIPRFGKNSAAIAILIAKHGSDLLLMKAALPIVERDVKEHGGSGEMFSVLYDELQITLGHRQRYGTQIGTDAEGKPYILPLEEPDKVDAYRKEIGILSFQEYLKLVSDNMGGIKIRVAGSGE